MRLAKYLASAGVASRRRAEELIRSGRVSVGGGPVTDPAHDVDATAEVTVDGEPVNGAPERVVYALNKPTGVVSTARDPQGRPTVVSLVPSALRLYPVGRLDADTTGLILLTNDGELAHRLTHPSFEVEKTYRAVVGNPPVRERALRALRTGLELEDGRTAPARVRRVGRRHARAHHPRGPQAPGPADVRADRAPGQATRTDPLRNSLPGKAGARLLPPPAPGRGCAIARR